MEGNAALRLQYFKGRLDATVEPAELLGLLTTDPGQISVVDVRNGPPSLLKERIPTALQIPQNVLLERLDQLSSQRPIVLYSWDTWCSLAARAAVALLERGFDVREMYGGIHAWRSLNFPTQPVDAAALAGQHDPLESSDQPG